MEQYLIFEEQGKVTCIDKLNGVTCTFEQYKFNETQKWDISNERELLTEGASGVAHICNAMAEWLMAEHPEYIFEGEVVILRCPECRYLQTEREWMLDAIYDHEGNVVENPIGGDHTICPECGALLHVEYDLIEWDGDGEEE